MVGFLRRRWGRLPRLLASYPPYDTPHPGDTRSLSVAQGEENLAYLLDVRERRLRIVAELLGHFGIDLHAGLENQQRIDAVIDQRRAQWRTENSAAQGDPRMEEPR